ncbi:MAG TPA: hypothetical protein VF403_19550 [Kofleriaceae bacterium]
MVLHETVELKPTITTRAAILVIASLALILVACGGAQPTTHTPTPPAAATEERIPLGPFTMAKPKAWVTKPTTSAMRVTSFTIPGAAGEAELVVYYFGEGGAGSADANIERWLGQLTQPDGRPTRDVATIEHAQVAGQEMTVVSVSGHYHAAAMPGSDEIVDKVDQALLAAIVMSPHGPYFFKLLGPKATVDAQAAAFRAALTSLQLVGP